MRIFTELRKLFNILGVKSQQKFNRSNLFALSLFAFGLGAMIAFLLFEVRTFVEFGNAFFGAISFFLNIFTLSSYVFKHKEVFDLFDQFERVIEQRKIAILNHELNVILLILFLTLKFVHFHRLRYSSRTL